MVATDTWQAAGHQVTETDTRSGSAACQHHMPKQSIICIVCIFIQCISPMAANPGVNPWPQDKPTLLPTPTYHTPGPQNAFSLAFPHMQKFLDHRSLPRDSKRHAVISIMWACMGVACVQFILAATVLIHWKNLREVHKWKLQQQQQQLQQQLTAVQPLTAAQTYQYGTAPPPPPPPAGYPAIAAGSSSLLPPLTPPTGSCPYNVPLQPAGHYSHPTPPGGYPGSGAAPLLGGYTNSTVVPPVGGGGNVLLPQQPAV